MVEAIIILAVFGIQDFRTKKLSTYWLWVAFALAAGMAALKGELFPAGVWGMALGMVMMAVSKLTKGQFGNGDAFLLIVTGVLLGLQRNLELFFLALLLASIYSGYLLVIKRCKKGREIAFVPFLAVAQVFLSLIHRLG